MGLEKIAALDVDQAEQEIEDLGEQIRVAEDVLEELVQRFTDVFGPDGTGGPKQGDQDAIAALLVATSQATLVTMAKAVGSLKDERANVEKIRDRILEVRKTLGPGSHPTSHPTNDEGATRDG